MEETIALIEQSHSGDKEARDKLVRDNLGLVWSIVKRFDNRGHEMEDLFQVGSIGLMKAIDKFDPSFQVKFSTYAVPMITGEIKRFLRDDGMIKVSRGLKENAMKLAAARNRLQKELGRDVTLGELEKDTGIGREEIVMALEASVEVESIHRSIYQSDGKEISLADKLMEKSDENEKLLDRMLLAQLIRQLEGKERELIILRYFREKTQVEVAKQLGISQVQVSRLEKKILLRLRRLAG